MKFLHALLILSTLAGEGSAVKPGTTTTTATTPVKATTTAPVKAPTTTTTTTAAAPTTTTTTTAAAPTTTTTTTAAAPTTTTTTTAAAPTTTTTTTAAAPTTTTTTTAATPVKAPTPAPVKTNGSGGNNGNNVVFTPAPTPGTITVKGTSPVKAARGKCMQDNWKAEGNNSDLVCRAKEVTVLNIQTQTFPDLTECIAGERIKLKLTGTVKFNSERYDPGWYIATDGGDAYTGVCDISPFFKDYSYTVTGGAVSWTNDFRGGNDVCGDVLTGGGPAVVTIDLVESDILCNDRDGDGFMDVCVGWSWRVAGHDALCVPSALTPGTPAKCDIDCHKLPIAVKAPPQVQKVVDTPVVQKATEVLVKDGLVKVGTKACLQSNANADLTCTGNAITLPQESLVGWPMGKCKLGETVDLALTGNLKISQSLTDPAWYVATDGGDALTGTCESRAFTSGNTYPLTQGNITYVGNACGDVNATKGTTVSDVDLLPTMPVMCEDMDGDGHLDVSICFSWSKIAGIDCGVPGDSTSCGCGRYNVKTITIESMAEDSVLPC